MLPEPIFVLVRWKENDDAADDFFANFLQDFDQIVVLKFTKRKPVLVTSNNDNHSECNQQRNELRAGNKYTLGSIKNKTIGANEFE